MDWTTPITLIIIRKNIRIKTKFIAKRVHSPIVAVLNKWNAIIKELRGFIKLNSELCMGNNWWIYIIFLT